MKAHRVKCQVCAHGFVAVVVIQAGGRGPDEVVATYLYPPDMKGEDALAATRTLRIHELVNSAAGDTSFEEAEYMVEEFDEMHISKQVLIPDKE